MLEIGLPQNKSVFPEIHKELFPASPGAKLQEITVSTFSIQTGYNPRSTIRSEIVIVFYPVGSKKC